MLVCGTPQDLKKQADVDLILAQREVCQQAERLLSYNGFKGQCYLQ